MAEAKAERGRRSRPTLFVWRLRARANSVVGGGDLAALRPSLRPLTHPGELDVSLLLELTPHILVVRLQALGRGAVLGERAVVAAQDAAAIDFGDFEETLALDRDVELDGKAVLRRNGDGIARLQHMVGDPVLVHPSAVAAAEILNRPVGTVKDERAVAVGDDRNVEPDVALGGPANVHDRLGQRDRPGATGRE